MARLKKNNRDLHDLLVDYYVGGMTFMALARKHGRSDCWVGRLLQKAEDRGWYVNDVGCQTRDGILI